MLIRMVAAAALTFVLVACGSDGGAPETGGPVPSWAPSAAAARQTCELTVAATGGVDVTSSRREIGAAIERLIAISEDADDDSREVLTGLLDSVRRLQGTAGKRSAKEQRQEAFDALTAYFQAESDVADWCRAAGSSAY